MESRTGSNYYSTDDDLLIQTIDRYDIVLIALPTGKTLTLATDDKGFKLMNWDTNILKQ